MQSSNRRFTYRWIKGRERKRRRDKNKADTDRQDLHEYIFHFISNFKLLFGFTVYIHLSLYNYFLFYSLLQPSKEYIGLGILISPSNLSFFYANLIMRINSSLIKFLPCLKKKSGKALITSLIKEYLIDYLIKDVITNTFSYKIFIFQDKRHFSTVFLNS